MRQEDGAEEQRETIDVETPVQRVWEVLLDVERWPEWASTVTAVRRLDDGPLAVGSRARVEQPRIPPTEYVVTELEPGRSFTWVATGPGVRTTARHVVEDLGAGGTRVTLSVEQAGPVGAVVGRFYRRLTDRYLAAEAEGIKARSEGRR
ncbi:SRPBCC family protein [Geodermatophilus sp. SYSU D00700]